MDDYRESIWGIRPQDRPWFQLLTLIGGISGSAVLTVLELNSAVPEATPGETARNVVLGIGGSFVAAGFIAWGILQAREIPVLIADWIREATRRRRERWIEQGREEGYKVGYRDAQEGLPPQSPASNGSNGAGEGDGANGDEKVD